MLGRWVRARCCLNSSHRWTNRQGDVTGQLRYVSTGSEGIQSELPAVVPDRWPGWVPMIGLELHVHLKGNLKLFSTATAAFDALTNSQVASFDAALPGSLPCLNPKPVHLALLACLALKSDINLSSTFDRKHYFYHDLPAGFQITQKYSPLATGGRIDVRGSDSTPHPSFVVNLDQIQLEQDTAKSSHDTTTGLTLIDLNRAGAALIEIVTKPDLKSPEEAAAFVRQLQAILRRIGTSDANMDRGELRCDLNVSVSRVNADKPGTRCEVKNLSGLRSLTDAIEYEISRQIEELNEGKTIVQATRGYDATTGKTFHLRSKEDAPDYRYMPDPELSPIYLLQEELDSLRTNLPELPDEALDRLQNLYQLNARDSAILVALGDTMEIEEGGASSVGFGVRFFESVAKGRDPQVVANWIIHHLLGQLAAVEKSLSTSSISAEDFGRIIDAVTTEKINGTTGKAILREYLAKPDSKRVPAMIKSRQSSTISQSDLVKLCEEVMNNLPEETASIRAGNKNILNRLVGEVMKRSRGRANAKQALDILEKATAA